MTFAILCLAVALFLMGGWITQDALRRRARMRAERDVARATMYAMKRDYERLCADLGLPLLADLDTLASALPAAHVEPEPEPRGGEAKLCPWCGSAAELLAPGENEPRPWDEPLRCRCSNINCPGSEAEMWLSQWNTRPIESRLERELGEARETNTKLHRRCQSAEAGLAAKLDAGTGPCGKTRTLGHALANSAATMYREQFEEVRQERDAARSALDEAEKRIKELGARHG